MAELVGRLSDFPDAKAVPVRAGGREIVVTRWRHELFAIRNVCPHQSQSFSPARVHGALRGSGQPGEIELEDAEPIIVCPWHTWEFRLRTGHCVNDPSQRVASYPVEVRDGLVYVEVDARAIRSAP